MIKSEKTRKNPKKWRLASLAASGGGGGSAALGGSTPPTPLLAMPAYEPRKPQPKDISLLESLGIDFYEALFYSITNICLISSVTKIQENCFNFQIWKKFPRKIRG